LVIPLIFLKGSGRGGEDKGKERRGKGRAEKCYKFRKGSEGRDNGGMAKKRGMMVKRER
jgi:hypothetical protein